MRRPRKSAGSAPAADPGAGEDALGAVPDEGSAVGPQAAQDEPRGEASGRGWATGSGVRDQDDDSLARWGYEPGAPAWATDQDGTAAWHPGAEWHAEDQRPWEGDEEGTDWAGDDRSAIDGDYSMPEGSPWYGTTWAGDPDLGVGYDEYDEYPGQPVYGSVAYEPESVSTPAAWDWGAEEPRRGPRRARRANGPWPELVITAAVAVMIAAVVLAVTGLTRPSPGPAQSAVSASGSAPPQSPSSTHPSISTSSRPATTSPTSAPTNGAALALTVTTALESDLVKSWLAANPGGVDLVPTDVAGTVTGEVYWALQRVKGTYWAGAVFEPSALLEQESSTAAGQTKLAQFKDWMYMFSWQRGGGPVWTLLGGVPTGSCPNLLVPTAVLAAWHLCGLQPAPPGAGAPAG